MCRINIAEDRWLRLLDGSDAQELQALIEANRDYLAYWMSWAAKQALGDTCAFIAHTRKQLECNDGFQLAVVEDDLIIGIVGFHGISWKHRCTSIGYWIAEPAQGYGSITLAVQALLDHAFGVWQLDRVEIRAAPENVRSRAIAERLGFRQERVLRDAERVGDRYLDQILYAILASDPRSPDRPR